MYRVSCSNLKWIMQFQIIPTVLFTNINYKMFKHNFIEYELDLKCNIKTFNVKKYKHKNRMIEMNVMSSEFWKLINKKQFYIVNIDFVNRIKIYDGRGTRL